MTHTHTHTNLFIFLLAFDVNGRFFSQVGMLARDFFVNGVERSVPYRLIGRE